MEIGHFSDVLVLLGVSGKSDVHQVVLIIHTANFKQRNVFTVIIPSISGLKMNRTEYKVAIS